MTPQAPVERKGWHTVIFAKDQPEYLPLPANTDGTSVETCWRLTWRERIRLFLTGELYLTLLTFGRPLQPIRLSVLRDSDEVGN